MSKPKRLTSHKQYLCTGETQYAAIATRYGNIPGFRCSVCGAELRIDWKKALHHKEEARA